MLRELIITQESMAAEIHMLNIQAELQERMFKALLNEHGVLVKGFNDLMKQLRRGEN